MKLSKYYSLKKFKAVKLSPLHFHLSMPTRKFEKKKDSFKIVFSHTKVIFSSPKSAKKDQNMTILSFSAAFNHRFMQKIIALLKSVNFLPKNDCYVCF